MSALRATRVSLAPLALALALAGCPAPEQAADDRKPDAVAGDAADAEQQTLYAFGASLARYASGMKLSESEVESIEEGLRDALLGKTLKVDPRSQGPQLQKLITERRAAAAADEKEAAVGFLAKAEQEPGTEKTTSGLLYKSEVEGTGASPKATDRVKVHYKGMLRDGTEFDSSTSRGEPASFHLNRVVPCWTEGVQKMKVGGKARLTCPAELAYGERGVPGRIPAGAPLVFEVELLEILPEVAAKTPAPPAGEPAEKPAAKPAPKPADEPAE